jgi:cytochrome c oxidase cbb3-type subunit 3
MMAFFSSICGVALAASVLIQAQAPAPAPAPAPPGGRGRVAGPPAAYPPRPPADPAVLERGKALYSVNCQFCHGAEARGGDGGGPNLLRSQLVLSDDKGELIAPVVKNGRPGPPPMPPIQLTDAQIADIAAFIHSFRVGGYDVTRVPAPTIVVGNAQAGETAFRARCASCHSVTGDLRGFGGKFQEPRDLQQMWLMPAAGRGRGGYVSNVPPMTVAVTLPSGQKFEGRLIRIDDFIVTLEQANGMPRSFGRNGDVPKVEVNDPIKPHRELLGKYTDKEIHDITAYLVTLK